MRNIRMQRTRGTGEAENVDEVEVAKELLGFANEEHGEGVGLGATFRGHGLFGKWRVVGKHMVKGRRFQVFRQFSVTTGT